ncbi:thioredoxin H2-like [Mercurialis annua]|uniref:thioredoxin H2-like n=1 Tax=Mercurialis annua TaxID=3986 RepID=UPI002160CA11|nr:thioredoxin H2-like [Mercurialis annua]
MGSMISGVYGTDPQSVIDDHSGITVIQSSNHWQLHFNNIRDSSMLMVVDFAASWCGPCKSIEPELIAMAQKYTDVSFAKIDVDELPSVSQEFGVHAMPTFVLLKGGKEVDRVVGAKKDELIEKIVKHRAS